MTTIRLKITLEEDEHVRVAAGPDYIRLTYGTQGVDQVKSRALDMAVEAGVMTQDEADRKRREHGMLASASHLLPTAPTSVDDVLVGGDGGHVGRLSRSREWLLERELSWEAQLVLDELRHRVLARCEAVGSTQTPAG